MSRASASPTYNSYLVVNRRHFPEEPDFNAVRAFLRQSPTPRTFAYQSEFSTSSYLLPTIYFRRNAIFDMPRSTERATAIRARKLVGSSSSDLVKAVARGDHDIAAVWTGTKASFEQVDSLVTRYGRQVHFVSLPDPLPNAAETSCILNPAFAVWSTNGL